MIRVLEINPPFLYLRDRRVLCVCASEGQQEKDILQACVSVC